MVSDVPTKSMALSWLDPEQIRNKEYDQERTAVPCELQTDAMLEDEVKVKAINLTSDLGRITSGHWSRWPLTWETLHGRIERAVTTGLFSKGEGRLS